MRRYSPLNPLMHIITKTLHEYKFDIFYMCIVVQNIDCRYTLESPWQGGPNEYPQFMFCIKITKNVNPSISIYM